MIDETFRRGESDCRSALPTGPCLRVFFKPLSALLLAFFLILSVRVDADDQVCVLDQAEDLQLQQELENLIDQQGLTAAAETGNLAVSLLVLSDPEHPRLAQINGDKMLYAASLPKIAILLGAAVAIDEGRITTDWALEQDVQNMIRYSCNNCANRVIERVGQEELLEDLQSKPFAFYDRQHGGGLWLGKEYGPHPAWRRDPLYGLSHGATTFQVARFYCGLQMGTLVSEEQNRMMLDALSRPGISHKFVKGLASHDELELYRKSGTWRSYHADSALVRSGDQAYVVVGLADNVSGGKWLERLAEPLNEMALAPH